MHRRLAWSEPQKPRGRSSGMRRIWDRLGHVVIPRFIARSQRGGCMNTRIGTRLFFAAFILAAVALPACGGGGGHHHQMPGATAFSCTQGTPYIGDQAGGGDLFGWCIARGNGSFSFSDLSSNGPPSNGGLLPSAAFPDLLQLTSSVNAGIAVEMPNVQLLVSPANLSTASTVPNNPMVLVVQQPGACPGEGSNYRFIALPKSGWSSSDPAFGSVSFAGGRVSVTERDLNGTFLGSESDPYTCDSSTSLLTFTQASNGKTRTVAVSPQGLFVDTAGNGSAGIGEAPQSMATILASGSFLGITFQPDGANKTQIVGFKPVGCPAPLCGFDPSSTSPPSNGMRLDPGVESSPGLFTSGTLLDGHNDIPFVSVANTVTVGGVNKAVLYGITFDSVANTAVAVLLLEQ